MARKNSSRFSVVGFVVAVVTVGIGTATGLAVSHGVGTYLGMLLGGFVAGLALEDRPLLEAGVAAVLASFGILLAGTLVGNSIVDALVALSSITPTTLLVSVALSFAVGAFGAYFGDDLRDGLTAPVEESAPTSTVFESAGSLLTATESSDERADDESAGRRAAEAEIDRQSEEAEIDRQTETVESADVELERE